MDKQEHLKQDLALQERAALQLDRGYNHLESESAKQRYFLSFPDVTVVDSAVASFAKQGYVLNTVTDDMVVFNHLLDGQADVEQQENCLGEYSANFNVQGLESKVTGVVETLYHAHLMQGGGAGSKRMAALQELEEEELREEDQETIGKNNDETLSVQDSSFPLFMPAGRNLQQLEGMTVNAALEYTLARLHAMNMKGTTTGNAIGKWLFQVNQGANFDSNSLDQDNQRLNDVESDQFRLAVKEHRKKQNQVFTKMNADTTSVNVDRPSTTTRDLFGDLDGMVDGIFWEKFPKTSRILNLLKHLERLHESENIVCDKTLRDLDELLQNQFSKQKHMKERLQRRRDNLETQKKMQSRVKKQSQLAALDPEALMRDLDMQSSDLDRWRRQAQGMARGFQEAQGAVAQSRLRREVFKRASGQDAASLEREVHDLLVQCSQWSGEHSDWCDRVSEYAVQQAKLLEREQGAVAAGVESQVLRLEEVLNRLQQQSSMVSQLDQVRQQQYQTSQDQHQTMQLHARAAQAGEEDEEEQRSVTMAPIVAREESHSVHVFDQYKASTQVQQQQRADVQAQQEKSKTDSSNNIPKVDVLTYEDEDPMMNAYLRLVTDTRVAKLRQETKDRQNRTKRSATEGVYRSATTSSNNAQYYTSTRKSEALPIVLQYSK